MNALNVVIESMTVQAVSSSRFLTGLYRRLADDKQANTAIQAGDASYHYASRKGLMARVPSVLEQYTTIQEVEAENKAWVELLQALVALNAFLSMAYEQRPGSGMRGLATAHHRALHKAIQGFKTAFPDYLVESGSIQAIQQGVTACCDALQSELCIQPDVNKQEALVLSDSIRAAALQALRGLFESLGATPHHAA